MDIPFCRHGRAVYFSAPITGMTAEHPVRVLIVSLARAVARAGYDLVADYVLAESQEEGQRRLAERMEKSYEQLRQAPHLIADYDVGLVEHGCDWLIVEWSERSDGVSAEAQVAYDRMRRDPRFPVLVLVREDVHERRMHSPFLARFGDFPKQARIARYRTLEDAVDRVSRFVSEVLQPLHEE